MHCLRLQDLEALVTGVVDDDQAQAQERHLRACLRCRSRLAQVSHNLEVCDRLLDALLGRAPFPIDACQPDLVSAIRQGDVAAIAAARRAAAVARPIWLRGSETIRRAAAGGSQASA